MNVLRKHGAIWSDSKGRYGTLHTVTGPFGTRLFMQGESDRLDLTADLQNMIYGQSLWCGGGDGQPPLKTVQSLAESRAG